MLSAAGGIGAGPQKVAICTGMDDPDRAACSIRLRHEDMHGSDGCTFVHEYNSGKDQEEDRKKKTGGGKIMINTEVKWFQAHTSEWGSLIALEGSKMGKKEIPFDIKRVYYIYGVGEDIRRGFHSHNDLEQILICVHGSVKILVKTPEKEEVVELDSPDKALYIGPMIWREMFDWKNEAVLMVLASKYYDENDYVRDYQVYEELAKTYFRDEV